MLNDLRTVIKLYKDAPEDAWSFDDVELNDEVRAALSAAFVDITFYRGAVKMKIGSNHCYVPLQYFLYAVQVKPLAMLLRRYTDLVESLKEKGYESAAIARFLRAEDDDCPELQELDQYSRHRFHEIFNDEEARLGARDIINEPNGRVIIRPVTDLYGSIILKAIPIPANSSSYLGTVIYTLAGMPDYYDVLEKHYARALPLYLYGQATDDLIYGLFFSLDTGRVFDDLFKNIGDARFITGGSIENLFLLSATAIPGNQSYIDEPLTYLQEHRKYVYVKKNIVEPPAGLDAVNSLLAENHTGLEVKEHGGAYRVSSALNELGVTRAKGGINKVLYGAPGTGKSYKIDRDTENHSTVRTVFHPDTQYTDFVGSLRPVTGAKGIEYRFRPGPFTTAYIKAENNPSTHVYLIIEELNRAAASAVFGEIFQLLDRDANGESVYSIGMADLDMANYIEAGVRCAVSGSELRLPSNLSIYATMNSSDQAVMALDTAFKRRWRFEYLPIDYSNAAEGNFVINIAGNRSVEVEWGVFAEVINTRLTEEGVPEDRLLGHRFLSTEELATSDKAQTALKSKLFLYLWDDVLRHGKRQQIFTSAVDSRKLGTFGTLIAAFDSGKPVFSLLVEEMLLDKGTIVPSACSSPAK